MSQSAPNVQTFEDNALQQALIAMPHEQFCEVRLERQVPCVSQTRSLNGGQLSQALRTPSVADAQHGQLKFALKDTA